MAYMQKYPTSAKLPDLLASVATVANNSVIVEREGSEAGEDQFNWPPPSAAARRLPDLKRA
ncbi:hypothetical protein ASG43_09405 [Aureimonas sp. Leaf454]|uniref:hypothetical protein n=1 Tax=Aureimonas sp. Leaf454 TaxID=1736381 RepID=UPI0006FFC722|nr:hypothetical protein [Aureimonas sp. Leaf454]KQT47338.1 hypothetical protein ASG43_09405 [Aureimonas sp. Leaf454]